jgi:hypothetical protein
LFLASTGYADASCNLEPPHQQKKAFVYNNYVYIKATENNPYDTYFNSSLEQNKLTVESYYNDPTTANEALDVFIEMYGLPAMRQNRQWYRWELRPSMSFNEIQFLDHNTLSWVPATDLFDPHNIPATDIESCLRPDEYKLLALNDPNLGFYCYYLFNRVFPNFENPMEEDKIFSEDQHFYYENEQIHLTNLAPKNIQRCQSYFKNLLVVRNSVGPYGFYVQLWKTFFENTIDAIKIRHMIFTPHFEEQQIKNLFEKCLSSIL